MYSSIGTTGNIMCGSAALDRFIGNARYVHPPAISESLFFDWLTATTARKLENDSEYQEQIKLRDFKRMHRVQLEEIDTVYANAKQDYSSSASYDIINQLERDITGGNSAITNMERFLSTRPEDLVDEVYNALSDVERSKHDALQGKYNRVALLLPDKITEIRNKEQQLMCAISQATEYQVYQEARATRDSVYDSIGLTALIAQTTKTQHQCGTNRNTRGKSFEQVAYDTVNECLLPYLATKHGYSSKEMIVLRNMKFGMASYKGSTAELDCLVCVQDDSHRPERLKATTQLASDSAKPPKNAVFCKVLAVIEVKRNPDDIGEAFLGYQKCLTWLSGVEDAYDTVQWKNRLYPHGHFKERPFIQYHNGKSLMFSPESFSHFTRRSLLLHPEIERDVLPTSLLRDVLLSVVGDSDGAGDGDDEDESAGSTENTTDGLVVSPPLSATTQLPANPNEHAHHKHNKRQDSNVQESTRESEPLSPPGDCQLFLDDLYFVVKDGAADCVHSKALFWALRKVSEETQFSTDLSDCREEVESLRLRLQDRFPHRLSAVDLVRVYQAFGVLNQMLLVCGGSGEEDKDVC